MSKGNEERIKISQTDTMRFLGELEEAVGTLLAVNANENMLRVGMDSAQFSVDFPSIHFLELAREQLSLYLGKRVAIFRDADATKPLRIRLAAPQNKLIVGACQR
jgi:hypothetical protein